MPLKLGKLHLIGFFRKFQKGLLNWETSQGSGRLPKSKIDFLIAI